MEIDFLGLSSPKFTMENPLIHPFSDSGREGIETSLSLCTSTSSLDSQTKIINLIEKDMSLSYYNNTPKKNEHSSPTVHPQFRPIFLFDLNDTPSGIRNIVSAENRPTEVASLNAMYSASCPNIFGDTMQEKNDKAKFGMPIDPRRRINSGYTPTIAMARKATLARFLEKRLHRLCKSNSTEGLKQAATPHMIRNQVNNSTNCQGSSTAITRSNKRKANSLVR
ncbi:uncharacterized protein LOC127242411 [Andrographis paniculata]|uniref:uncharacterized protein LOC127242411 n=1 Tax=Andrographis paniculata TaxID=175694 RepID=UPI0021E86D7E|nr:uncharacterized protein LOC127242411 [Andrographis paniculata]